MAQKWPTCGLQLPRCPSEQRVGGKMRGEAEEEKHKEEERKGKLWPTSPSTPCAWPPWGLQLPARPARDSAVTGHRGPRPRSRSRLSPEHPPDTPITAQPVTCTAGVYSFHNKGSAPPAPRRTPELGVCSSVFNEIVAKSPKRRLGGSGSSVFTHRGCEGTGEAAGEPLSPGVSRCACLTVLIYSNSRNVIYSFLCGPIRQISTYL